MRTGGSIAAGMDDGVAVLAASGALACLPVLPVVEIESYGIDDAFIAHNEPRLTNGLRPDAVLARAKQLPWVAQAGAIEAPRMVRDAKRFDMNCGCKLFYPNGVN